MEDLKLTPEEVQNSVLAAYDSVNLINDLKAKESLTEDEQYTLKRNEEHIAIMLGKDWFVEGLTPEQKNELDALKK